MPPQTNIDPNIILDLLESVNQAPVLRADNAVNEIQNSTVEQVKPEPESMLTTILGALSGGLQTHSSALLGRPTGPTGIERLRDRRLGTARTETALRVQQRGERLDTARDSLTTARSDAQEGRRRQDALGAEQRGERRRVEAEERAELRSNEAAQESALFRLRTSNPFLRLPADLDPFKPEDSERFSAALTEAAKKEAAFKKSLESNPRAAERAEESTAAFLTQLRTLAFGGLDQNGQPLADIRARVGSLKDDELLSESRSTRRSIESFFRTTRFSSDSDKQEALDLMREINDVFDVEMEKRGMLPSGARVKIERETTAPGSAFGRFLKIPFEKAAERRKEGSFLERDPLIKALKGIASGFREGNQ